jgi:transposase
LVVMEACGSSHHWGREIQALGHEIRLIAPASVKRFVKRQKNDMADAEAIAEAASRPTMRFVAVKSIAKQASAMVFKTRDLLVRQRTQTVNALRGHLTEYGVIAPQGLANLDRLVSEVRSSTSGLPAIVTELSELLRHRPNLRRGDRSSGAGPGNLRQRARLRRLAWPHPKAAFHRWEGEAGGGLQDGPA